MSTRTLVLIAAAIAVLAAAIFLLPALFRGGGGGRIEMAQIFARDSFQCTGEFELALTIKNASPRTETISFQFRNADNVEGARMSASSINLGSAMETTVEVFGKLTDPCHDGKITVVANGGRVSGLLAVEAEAVAVKAAGHPGLSSDNTGRFDSTRPNQPAAVFTCCGVGFAGRYTLDFLLAPDTGNVTSLAANPTEFQCVGIGNHSVDVTGNLVNLSRQGLVRLRAKSPRGNSCRTLIPVEAAR